jgi:hypothetical protein
VLANDQVEVTVTVTGSSRVTPTGAVVIEPAGTPAPYFGAPLHTIAPGVAEAKKTLTLPVQSRNVFIAFLPEPNYLSVQQTLPLNDRRRTTRH